MTTRYHRTHDGRILRCREEQGKCPYGGPVQFGYKKSVVEDGIPADSFDEQLAALLSDEREFEYVPEGGENVFSTLKKDTLKTIKSDSNSSTNKAFKYFETKAEANRVTRKIAREAKAKKFVRDYENWKKNYDSAVEKANLNFNEREMAKASQALYAYDDGKGMDDKVNSALYSLQLTHPFEYQRLGDRIGFIKSSEGRKKAILDMYNFYTKNPDGIYKNMPIIPADKEVSDPYASARSRLFDVADRSGDPELQGKIEYIAWHHPDSAETIFNQMAADLDPSKPRDFTMLKKNIDDYYTMTRANDILKTQAVVIKAKTGKFQKAANKLANLFRRMSGKREVLIGGSMSMDKNLVDGSTVGTRWVHYHGSYYRMNSIEEKTILDAFFEMRTAKDWL